MTVPARFLVSSCLAASLLVACDQASFSPTSPSGRASVGGSGAVITGTASGMALAPIVPTSSTERLSADRFTTAATTRPVTVTIVGTDISTVIDGSGRFRFDNVPAGDVRLRFTATGLDATLTLFGVQAGDRIDLKVRVTDTSVRIEAEHRERRDDDDDDEDEDEDEDDEDDDNELKGTVSNVTGACPTLTFRVNGTTVRTNGATKFELTCSRVANGTRIEVKGARQGDGTILATEVELDD